MWANNLPKHFILFFTLICPPNFMLLNSFCRSHEGTEKGKKHLHDCMYSSRLCCTEKTNKLYINILTIGSFCSNSRKSLKPSYKLYFV